MKKTFVTSLLTSIAFVPAALANFSLNIGAIHVSPDESSSYLNVVESVAGLPQNSTQLAVDSNTQLGLTVDYGLSDNWALELVAATPFSHEITLTSSVGAVNGLKVGDTKHLPPTLLAQYHFFSPDNVFRPFVGLGLNYTVFFSEGVNQELIDVLIATGAAGGDDEVSLHLDDSIGVALQAGFNYRLNQNWGIHGTLAWADIDSDAEVRVNDTAVQPIDVSIDPMIVMLGGKFYF